MVAGDKEIILASEEITRNNVLAGIEFGNETRKLLRELETRFEELQTMVLDKDKRIDELQGQITNLQQALYAGGTG